MLTIAVKVQIDFVPSCPFAPLRLTSWISYRNSSMPLTLPSARGAPYSSMFSSTPLPTRQTRRPRPHSSMLSSTPLSTRQTRPNSSMLSSTPLPTRQTRPNSSMLSSTPLPTRQTRPNSSMLSSIPLPTRQTRQTRPNPTLNPIVLSHASFNAQQYTDLLIVDATASSYRFKAPVDTGAAVNLISPTLVESLGLLLTPLPAVQPVILADGSSSAFQVRHHVRIRFCLPTLCRSWTISALVCPTGSTEMILGLPWIKANSTIVETGRFLVSSISPWG